MQLFYPLPTVVPDPILCRNSRLEFFFYFFFFFPLLEHFIFVYNDFHCVGIETGKDDFGFNADASPTKLGFRVPDRHARPESNVRESSSSSASRTCRPSS